MFVGFHWRGVVVLAFVGGLLATACVTKPRGLAASAPAPPAPSAEDAGDIADAIDLGDQDAEDPSVVATEDTPPGPCPADMTLVDAAALRFCVDRYEASLVEVLPDGSEQAYPHYLPVDGHDVRAVSVPHVFPQGYISEVQAQDACGASGKYLCKPDEWKVACMGPAQTTFPYGDARRPGVCHDTGKSAVIAVFGAKAVAASTPFTTAAPSPKGTKPSGKRAHVTKGNAAQTTRPRVTHPGGTRTTKTATKPSSARKPARRPAPAKKSTRPPSVDPGVWARLNDPGLGRVEGALARTGEHEECVNAFGVFDMVGNLHEWVATDPAAQHGTFAGGYYLDTTINGDGCLYRTQAHAHDYHDYSTGFRCCSSPR